MTSVWGRKPCSDEHDRICRYVAQPDKILKIAARCAAELEDVEHDQDIDFEVDSRGLIRAVRAFTPKTHCDRASEWARELRVIDVKLERPVYSRGNSPRVLGFADVVAVIAKDSERRNVVIEVKSGVVSRGEVLRQLRFYNEFFGDSAWYVVVAPQLGAETAEYLRNAGIIPFSLGSEYLTWQAPNCEYAPEI